MSTKKGKKKSKHGTEPNILVNTSALLSYQSPANSIACLTEMFGEKIEIDVIQLVLSECDNDVNQAAESLSSLVDSDSHNTRDDCQFQESQYFSCVNESTVKSDISNQNKPEVENQSSVELFLPDSSTKSYASSLNYKLQEPIVYDKPCSFVRPLSSPFKSFSNESSYLASSLPKNQTNKVVDKISVVVQHICTIINTLKYDELKEYLPGYFPSPNCDRILNNIKLGLPVLIILRGLPGCGKSTLASTLKGDGVVLSTDDYFYEKGYYNFVPTNLPEAHEWNQQRAKKALVNNTSPIIIDNTNLMVWEMSPYVSMGLKHNYIVEIIEPATSWKFKPSELSKRNAHGVSRKSIEDMLARYQKGEVVCRFLRRNKFASLFECPFSDLKGENSKSVPKKKSNGSNKTHVNSETEKFKNNPLPDSCHTPNKVKQSSKVKVHGRYNQPVKSTAQNNSKLPITSKDIHDNSKNQKSKSKLIDGISEDSTQLKDNFNPLIKHGTFEKGPLWEQMKCFELSTGQEINFPNFELANDISPLIANDISDQKISYSGDTKCTNIGDELKCPVVEPKIISVISPEVDKYDPDSSESEISVDVRSESETNCSQSVSSWVASSEDMSESENSERHIEEIISTSKENIIDENSNKLNTVSSLNPDFPKPPRNKPIACPLGTLITRNDSSEKPEELEVFSEGLESWDANCSDSKHISSIDSSKPKPRRETWKQIEKSSLAILISNRDVSTAFSQQSEPLSEPFSSLHILETKPKLNLDENNLYSLNCTEKSREVNVEFSKSVLSQNTHIQSATKLNEKDANSVSSDSTKYIGPDWEFPKPYNLTSQQSPCNKINPKKHNRKPLIIGADKYLGKNWGLPDLVFSDFSSIQVSNKEVENCLKHCATSETQTESKDFMFSNRIRKNQVTPEELKESVYKIISANLHHPWLKEKENLGEELDEQSFSARPNMQFDASTSTEDYSLDIADDQKLPYIQECFPDLSLEELETYLGLCQGDVHWAINIIIENGHVSQKSPRELGIAEEKYKSPLNTSFKSISLESLLTPEKSPFANPKSWSSDNVLSKTPSENMSFTFAKQIESRDHQQLKDIKSEKSESNSEAEEDFQKISDKIVLTLSLEDAQELQFRYGPVVENNALSAPGNREIALDPELVYSLWMTTQSFKESNYDQYKQRKRKKVNAKPRRNLFPETLSESKKIASEPQTLSEIMDMEYALKLDEEEKLKKDTRFIKEKRLELYSIYPGMDRRYLDAVFDSNNYNVEESKFCIDGTYAMIENDSKSAFSSPIASELRKIKNTKGDTEDTQTFLSNGDQKGHLGIGPNHFLNWVSPDVLSSNRKFSPNIEGTPVKGMIQASHSLAQAELAAKREMSSKAVKAYHSKMVGVAAYYAEKAREHHWNANEHFNAICESIKADSKTYELDLHGCYVREGMKLLQQFINRHEQRLKNWPERSYPKLSIITGFGKHSEKGPVLQPSVCRFLKENNYLFNTNKFCSVFYVTLKKDEESVKRK